MKGRKRAVGRGEHSQSFNNAAVTSFSVHSIKDLLNNRPHAWQVTHLTGHTPDGPHAHTFWRLPVRLVNLPPKHSCILNLATYWRAVSLNGHTFNETLQSSTRSSFAWTVNVSNQATQGVWVDVSKRHHVGGQTLLRLTRERKGQRQLWRSSSSHEMIWSF